MVKDHTWQRIDLAIGLLGSFREDGDSAVHTIYNAHRKRIVDAALGEPNQQQAFEVAMAELVDGLTFVSNILLNALAQVTGKAEAEILDMYRAQTGELIENAWRPPDNR